MADPLPIMALALDAMIGWPDAVYRRVGHPVGLFAGIIDACALRWNKPTIGELHRRLLGVVTLLILVSLTVGSALALDHLAQAALGPLSFIPLAALAWPALAQRSLYDHVRPVAIALERGDTLSARQAVSMIVGRDTCELNTAGIARAAIESLAESFCDGVTAPLFWLIVAGLPGLWAYKAVNTADSLIGHRERRWRDYGWAAARADDVLNLLPARLGAIVICIAGGGGWKTLWRDHARHASPNAGWTEAAMAGVLGVGLAGPVSYDGVLHSKDWIGAGRSEVDARDIRKALVIYVRSCLILAVIATVLVWERG